METLEDEYSEQNQRAVSGLVELHQNELSLIRGQSTKILYRQKLRKQNIDDLQQIKNQHPAEQVSFPRRNLVFRLDFEKSGRRRNGCMITSEYGNCFSFTKNNEIGEQVPFTGKDSDMGFQSVWDTVNNNTCVPVNIKELSFNLLSLTTNDQLPFHTSPLCTRNLDSGGSEQVLQLPLQSVETRNSCECTAPSSGFLENKSLTDPAASLTEETSPSKYSVQHEHTRSRLVESQHSELHLIKELSRNIICRQALRKEKIESLQLMKNQHQPEQFPRRTSVFSIDLENLGGRRNTCTSTSDYGTCSSIRESDEAGERFSLDRTDSSMSCQSKMDDAVNNTDTHIAGSQGNLSSSSDSTSCFSDFSDSDCYVDDSDLELTFDRHRHITLREMCAIIPEKNLSGHLQSEFTLEVIEDMSFYPKRTYWQILASEVIEMKPHGAKFYEDNPVIISLPYDVKLESSDQVMCLCSNTGEGQTTSWKELNPEDYSVFASHVEIKAYHFSLFAVVVTKSYPEARKTIKAGTGGCLYVPEVPGVEILFPETSLLRDIETSVKVLYADEPYDVDHSDPEALALAAPVVQLGPHGCVFNPHSSDFVTVRLPLPNGKEIQERYGDRQLTFWCSSTKEDEALNWQQFQPKFVLIDNDDDSLCSVYFSVEHFSFFRVLWGFYDAVLRAANLGASRLTPIFQFNVCFQALMSETNEGRFGMCVACYIFGKPPEDHGSFPIVVGKSISPKLLSRGKLQIRLESEHFKADSSVGIKELLAEENFAGRPFEVQFGCQFTGEPPDYGTFGSVHIEQPSSLGGNKAFLFFLLNKPRDSTCGFSDKEGPLNKELTGVFSIKAAKDMGDGVWHEVSASPGNTRWEVNNMNSSDNPVAAVTADCKCRGEMPQVTLAFYKTGSPGSMTKKQMSNGSERVMGQERSEREPAMCSCVKKARKRRLDEPENLKTKTRKRRFKEPVNWEQKFLDLSQDVVGNGKWKQLGRALGVGDNKIQEIEHDCSVRQDGLQEKAYQVLIAWRDLYPDQLNLDNLSSALLQIGLSYAAKKHC